MAEIIIITVAIFLLLGLTFFLSRCQQFLSPDNERKEKNNEKLKQTTIRGKVQSRALLCHEPRFFFYCIAVFFLVNSNINQGLAQTSTNSESNVKIFLSSETGFGYGQYIDKGVSPLIYQGLMLSQGLAFSIDIKKIRLIANATAFGGLYGKGFKADLTDSFNGAAIINSYNSKGFDGDLSITSIYRFKESENRDLRLYIGGSAEEYFDYKKNDNYQNSATGIGNFININVDFLGEFDFAFFNNNKEGKRKPFTASFRLSTPLTTLITRPGYSYLNNANGNSVNYVTNARFFAGTDTETGLSLNLKNGNRIKASYFWTYITTGKSSMHRFDDSKHMFILSFHFKLN